MELAWSCCCFLLGSCVRALRRLFQLPALLCCEAMAWAVTFIAFPLRVLTAVERERKLGRLVAEMQAQMDDLAWENTMLEDKLRAALREQEAVEAVLDEMEDEQEDALARIRVLETQLKALRQENMRLNEHKGKSKWDKPAAAAAARHGNGGNRASETDKKSAKRGRGEEDASAGEEAKHADPASVLALTTEAPSPVSSNEALVARAVARRRSLFSLGMSLAVGAVAWSADAPCLPLLAGLFAVVGVSMRSVSRLRRAGAGDAVALLGLNWFLLGLLTSPMLPGVARAIVPRAGQALGPALTGLAATVPL